MCFNNLGRWAAVAGAVMLFGGCGGGDSSRRFSVSGNVTIGGAPVPAGQILFEPDGSKDNQGPAGFAAIKDGRFDTAAGGMGTVGGPHVARISGNEAAASGGGRLFADYTINLDLPMEKASRDFDVPASAKLPSESHPAADPNYQGP